MSDSDTTNFYYLKLNLVRNPLDFLTLTRIKNFYYLNLELIKKSLSFLTFTERNLKTDEMNGKKLLDKENRIQKTNSESNTYLVVELFNESKYINSYNTLLLQVSDGGHQNNGDKVGLKLCSIVSYSENDNTRNKSLFLKGQAFDIKVHIYYSEINIMLNHNLADIM